MNEKEQNAAIAQLCGWVNVFVDKQTGTLPPVRAIMSIPDYVEDLNAMHDAEKIMTPKQVTTYKKELVNSRTDEGADYAYQNIALSTSSQRAKAFLKTFQKWVDYVPKKVVTKVEIEGVIGKAVGFPVTASENKEKDRWVFTSESMHGEVHMSRHLDHSNLKATLPMVLSFFAEAKEEKDRRKRPRGPYKKRG